MYIGYVNIKCYFLLNLLKIKIICPYKKLEFNIPTFL